MIVAFNHHYLSVSSLLLLRNTPHTFAFIPILPMCLSSRNRSIYKAFSHIMPYYAQVYKGMIYSKTGVPWQMKSTFIIVLIYSFLPGNALFCKGFLGFLKCVCRLASWQNTARWSKLLLPVSSKIGSKTRLFTTKDFIITTLYSLIYYL